MPILSRYRAGLLLLAIASLSLAATRSAGGQSLPAVHLAPLTSTVEYDDGRFSVFIRVSNLDHQGTITYDDDRDTVPDREEASIGLGAFEILLDFDPDVVRVDSIETGPFIGSSGRPAQCFEREPERGQYALACLTTGGQAGAQGSGTLATATLRPVARGMSFIALDAQLSGPLGDSVAVQFEGGVVEVRGGPTTPPTPGPGEESDNSGVPRPVGGGPSSPGGSGNGADDPNVSPADGAPIAGTGYQPFSNDMLTLAGAFALAGGVLLLVGVRAAGVMRT